jgi:exopolysaccharide biosynthesis predicted pyruvyltransferase EpsI
MKILILGYYDKNNLGDELFKLAFKKILYRHDLVIRNVYNIDEIPYDIDIVVIGGGDVINNYFMDRIKILLKNYIGPVYGLSIGIPYKSAIEDGQLDMFDYIITRNKNDIPELTTRFGKDYVRYFPDFSLFLSEEITICVDKNHCKKKIGLCLAQDYYKNNDRFFKDTVEYIKKLSRKYIVYLIAFNTNESNHKENDNLLNCKIKECIDDGLNEIVVINSRDFKKVIEVFKDLDLCICSRFHSCMLSIMTYTPFIPMFTTRKIRELVDTMDFHKFSYKIDTDEKYKPVYLNIKQMLNLTEFALLKKQENMALINKFLNRNYFSGNISLTSFINNLVDSRLTRNSPPYFFDHGELEVYIKDIISSILVYFNKNSLYDIEDKDLLCEVICFKLTRICKPDYYYGLREKMNDENFEYIQDLIWIVKDFHGSNNNFSALYKKKMGGSISKPDAYKPETYKPETYKPDASVKLNLTYIDQNDLKGYHRSGWQYVIEEFYKSNSEDHDAILVDTYVDRTFLWKHDVYKAAGVLPYSKPWVGFIHHTFEVQTENNVGKILNNKDFIESLRNCRCLFVLSKYLRDKLRKELCKLNIYTKVKALVHPTEFPELYFNITNFKNKKQRDLVQIGAWLRNTYAIFRLDVSKTEYRKHALVGKNMNNYYKNQEEVSRRLLFCTCDCEDDDVGCRGVCRSKDCNYKKCDNKYIVGLEEYTKELHNSVNIISNINNDDYDKLLSESIVFLNLIDASAVNTLLECFVRNTPIIVNPLPAVVELLGKDYPLYYTDYKKVGQLLEYKNIEKAFKYLKSRDKTKITIGYFMGQFNKKLAKCSC